MCVCVLVDVHREIFYAPIAQHSRFLAAAIAASRSCFSLSAFSLRSCFSLSGSFFSSFSFSPPLALKGLSLFSSAFELGGLSSWPGRALGGRSIILLFADEVRPEPAREKGEERMRGVREKRGKQSKPWACKDTQVLSNIPVCGCVEWTDCTIMFFSCGLVSVYLCVCAAGSWVRPKEGEQ